VDIIYAFISYQPSVYLTRTVNYGIYIELNGREVGSERVS